MKNLIVAALLAFASATPALAWTGESGMIDELEFVTETQIPGPGETNMSLCYQVRALKVLGFALTSDIQNYVLASDRCEGSEQRAFTTDQMETAQSLNLIPADIPAVAANDLQRNLRSYGLWVAVLLGLFAVIWRRVKSLLGYDLSGPLRKNASQRILSAMCHTAKCDGLVSSKEIAVIGQTAQRLTRREFATADIMRLSDQADPNLSARDFIAFGKGLRDREKDIMMHAVLYVSIADGRMLPSEYTFVTELAHGLGMPAEDFRRMLNTAMADIAA